MHQTLLTPGSLLDAKGRLKQAGYATSLVRAYDRSAIGACPLRIKEWDYYCIIGGSPEGERASRTPQSSTADAKPATEGARACGYVLALTIADNSYMSLDSVSLIDLQTGYQHTWSAMGLLPMGKRGLPATSQKGDVAVEKSAYALRFENDGDVRTLTVRVDDFQKGKPLTARIRLTDAPEESMVIATPFANKPTAFYYNQKINCLKAEGEVLFDGQTIRFDPSDATAVLDWGRGVWTYQNTWYWSSLSGYIQGVPFGFNLGYGFGDTSKATENMLFYDGRAHKLENVTFDILQQNGRDDFLSPWRIRDDAGRLDLTFTPILDRASRTSAVVIESDQHQVFGRFSGTAVLDEGTVLQVQYLVGFAEKVKNKW